MPFEREPPFYGLGAIEIRGKVPVAFDTETFRFPTREMETGGGKKKSYIRRAVPRLVCGTFAGLGKAPEAALALVERGRALLRQDGRAWSLLCDRKGTQAFLANLLEGDQYIIVTHTGPFDLAVAIHASKGRLTRMVVRALALGKIIDVAVRQKLFAIAQGTMQEEDDGRGGRFGLAELVSIYLGVDRSDRKKGADIWRVRYHELDGVPLAEWPEDAITYALDDALDTLFVAIAQAPLDTPRLGLDFMPYTTADGGVINEAPQIRAAWALFLMSAWGMRIDRDLYESWGLEIEAAISYAEEMARRAGFLRHNGKIDMGKLKEMIRLDFTARGKLPPLTDSGLELNRDLVFPDDDKYVSTTKEVLVECRRLEIDGVPVLKLWGETGFMRKMRSTYYDPAGLGLDYAMLYGFDVLKATGRTSGKGPNLQNPPRKGPYRELFIARLGHYLCSTDFSSQELRVLGQIHYWWFGTSALRDAFLADKDPHEIYGAEIAGVSLEIFQGWKKTDNKRYKMYRQLAKALNFGAPGGLGAEKLIAYAWATYNVDMYESAVASGYAAAVEGEDAQEAVAIRFTKHLIAKWKETWPEAKRYMDLVGEECQRSGSFTYVTPVSWRQRGGCTYTSGNNNGFQSLASDGTKDAAWRLSVMMYLPPDEAMAVFDEAGTIWPTATREEIRAWCEALYGCRSVLFLHDEIITEGPAETAHRWAPAQGRVLEEAMVVFTPDVPQQALPALMEHWYKNAEPVYNADGLLVPWRPDTKDS